MARKPTGNPTGRPPKEFNKQIFENLCQIQCTVNELEAVLQSDQRTIDNWCKREYGDSFSTIYKRFAECGKPSLRRFQWNLAKTNASMAIWLGKIHLGQKDPDKEDAKFDHEALVNFNAIMKQIGDIQVERKIEIISKSAEAKS